MYNQKKEKNISSSNNINITTNIANRFNDQLKELNKNRQFLNEIKSFEDFLNFKSNNQLFYDLELELREMNQNFNDLDIENNEFKNEIYFLNKKYSNLELKYSNSENFNKELKQKNKEIQIRLNYFEEKNSKQENYINQLENKIENFDSKNNQINQISFENNKTDANKNTIDLDRTRNHDINSKDLLFSPIKKQKYISNEININENMNNKFSGKNNFHKQNSYNTNAIYNELSAFGDNKSEYVEYKFIKKSYL